MISESTPKRRRTKHLIANFQEGYASGWRFAVPESFKDNLDIRWTETVTTKKNELGEKIKTASQSWTQGMDYKFSHGDCLYDTRLAYDLNWKDALNHLQLMIQVTSKPYAAEMSFRLLRPTESKEEVEKIAKFDCSHKDFVHLLKTGVLPKGDTFIDMFQTYAF